MVHHKQQVLHLEITRPGYYCPYAEVVARRQRPLSWYLYRLSQVAALLFFCFILWLIYLANTGQGSIFFKIGSSLSFRDKLGHFVLYALFTLKLNAAFCFRQVTLGRYSLYLGSLLVFCFSFAEEMSQYYIPTRSVECWDLIANTLGIALSTCLCWWIDKSWVHKKKFKGSAV